jgi:hypothetical protein
MYGHHLKKDEDYAFFPYDKYKDGGREISILHCHTRVHATVAAPQTIAAASSSN